jgi:hypothetical protein
MKQMVMVTMVLCFVAAEGANAQGIKVGVKGGATVYKLDGISFKDKFLWGYHAGVTTELMWSKNWGIQPEFLFNQSNTQTGYSFDTLYRSINPGTLKDIKLNYLSIPILLSWRPSPFITFQAGPQFSVLMSKQRTLLQDGAEAFKAGNVSMLAGVQVNLLSFRIYGRYSWGLVNMNNIDDKDRWQSQGAQLGVGFVF